jgi:hypothetical protein
MKQSILIPLSETSTMETTTQLVTSYFGKVSGGLIIGMMIINKN